MPAQTTQKTAAPTSNAVGGMMAISAISNAYMAYEAGRMRENAYNHQAAMAEINAKQIGIDAQFMMADRMTKLRSTLALQNVLAAATGRSGGSIENLSLTSLSNLRADEQRLKMTGKARKVASLMDVASNRAAGKTAAKQGLLRAIGTGAAGLSEASEFIS